MNISIIGASAGVGLATVKQTLERGHRVTTLSRSEVSLPESDNLKTIKGNALNEDDLRNAIRNSDAIIVTLGTKGSIRATTLCADFARILLKLHSQENIKVPVIILSGFGASESIHYANIIQQLVFRFILNKVYADKEKMERLIRKSTLNWELVRPGILTNKPLTQKYKVDTTYHEGMKTGSISRNDVADYMVRQAEKPTNIGKSPAIRY